MGKTKKHWLLKKLEYLRREARKVNFSSGTTRRRRDLIEIISAINDSCRAITWYHNFDLAASDNGASAKIILTPRHLFNKDDGKIILEFPSFHNTHRTVFIFFETAAGGEVAKALQEKLHEQTMGFEFPLIFKQGRKLIPVDLA